MTSVALRQMCPAQLVEKQSRASPFAGNINNVLREPLHGSCSFSSQAASLHPEVEAKLEETAGSSLTQGFILACIVPLESMTVL